MELIGGILADGILRREVTFRPASGALELELAELADEPMSLPDIITRLIASAVDSLGGAPSTAAEVAALSVGDRQHLTRAVGTLLGIDLVWLAEACTACSERFEVPVRQSVLPVKPASPAYPSREIEVAGWRVTVRSPTGVDQSAIAAIEPDSEAKAALLARLVSGPDGFDLSDLGEAALAELEVAIEDMSPEVAEEVVTACPECGAENRVAVDPYLTLAAAGTGILDEIHQIASAYHWPEDAILAIPRHRRKRYLALIDRKRGLFGAPAKLTG
jgi:hypothetical protein